MNNGNKRPDQTGVWTEAALKVLRERYLRRGSDEVLETPEDMCWRVALAIAGAESRWGRDAQAVRQMAEQFYGLMVEQLFLPNSPTLMNAGTGSNLQYSACYVLPVPDSIEGIFEAIKRAALVHQSGGGTGFAFSRLRPKGSPVRTSGGVASGPVSFMQTFDAATGAIKQGGKRRGANMGILRVDHPDILEFIECKLSGGITNFNISVAATDAFMEALKNDGEYDLVAAPGWPRPDDGGSYQGGEPVGRLRAREVFDRIVRAAWKSGDPGLVFIDRINRSPANPVPELGEIEATNPCGEQPLLPNEACNLGSINLAKLVREPSNGQVEIDWDRLGLVVRLAVRFLDDVIEVNPYPLPEIDAMVKANRRIGLGVMGWADLLFELGIPYDSDEALSLAKEVMGFINRIGHDESAKLASERGHFPNWEKSIYRGSRPLRNATVTTIAPTGTISIIANCSSGIEPVFALAFEHRVKQPDGGERRLQFINPIFERLARERGFSDDLMERVSDQGTLVGIEGIPEDLRQVFVTAHEIAPEWHVRMQAAFQSHTDNGVSKTINLPHSATVEDVARAYLLAYESGCLGITIFRDGCKEEQVLHVGTGGRQQPEETMVKPRPQRLPGQTYRVGTPQGTAFITVNENSNGQPFEVFVNVGKAGSDTAAVAEALGRLISLILRLPSSLFPHQRIKEIVGQLSGIGGVRSLGFGPDRVLSLPDAIARVLAEYIGLEAESSKSPKIPEATDPLPIGDLCPECGLTSLIYEEGCRRCYSCGYTEC